MRHLSAQWFSGFHGNQEEKNKLENAIRSSTVVLDILAKFMEQELHKLTSDKEDDYQYASWPYLQANRLGRARVYRDLLTMVKLDRTTL